MAEKEEGQQAEGQQAEAAAQNQSESVTKERFDEVNAKLAAAEETNALLQQNMALASANANAARLPRQPPDDYEAAGIKIPDDPENDMLNFADQRKLDDYRAKKDAAEKAEIHFKLDHPDFAQVVGTPEQINSGQWAKPLADAIKDDPTIAAKIQASGNPRSAAYSIAKLYEQRASSKPAKTAEEEAAATIQEALAAVEKPGSASAASGQAGLDMAHTIANETDEEFEARKQAVLDRA